MRLGALAAMFAIFAIARVTWADEPSSPGPPGAPGALADDDAGADTYAEAPEKKLDPLDVSVRGDRDTEPGGISLTRAETRLLPGAFGDPFRAIEALPGVAPIASGVPYFYVRGAPPGDVGYFLDGIRVPLLFHLGLGPSVVHPALIEKVELVPGGDPTLGRYAGGVVEGTLSRPWSRPHAEGQVRAVDAGALVEVPWADGAGAALAAGRYSYTALLFSLLNSAAALDYWDYAGRVTQEVAPGHRLTVFAFGAHDSLGEKDDVDPEKVTTLFDTTFHRLAFRYEHQVTPHTLAKYDLVLGLDSTALGEDQSVEDRMLDVKASVHHEVSDDVSLDVGVDLTADDYDMNLDQSDQEAFSEFFASRTDFVSSVYAVMRLGFGRIELRPSLRADLYVSGHENALGLDPGFAARLAVTPELTFEARAILASQMPSFIVAGPGFRPGLDQGGLQRAFHTSFGATIDMQDGWSFGATLFSVAFFEMNDALGTNALSGEGFPDGFDQFADRYDGQSYGIELSAKRRLTKRLGGIVAVTVARSERANYATDIFASGFDRTFVGSAALTYDFGHGWHGGIKQLLYSGAPLVTSHDDVIEQGGRLPPFYRLDWRIEKRFDIGETGYITLIAELLNGFFASEVIGQDCQTKLHGSTPYLRCDPNVIGPVSIPSLGVEGGF